MTHDGWTICRAEDRRFFEESRLIPTAPAARAWLRQNRIEAGEARRYLAVRGIPAWKYPKNQALERFAERLARGEFILCRERLRRTAQATAAAPPTTGPAFPLSERHAPPPERQRDADENSFAGDADLAAIAAVQKEAAELGLPFCEECARAQQQSQ